MTESIKCFLTFKSSRPLLSTAVMISGTTIITLCYHKYTQGPFLVFDLCSPSPLRPPLTNNSCSLLSEGRRQQHWFITLPTFSVSTDVQEVHTSVLMPSLCVHMLFVLKHALLHPLAPYLQLPVKFLPKPEKKTSDEEV